MDTVAFGAAFEMFSDPLILVAMIAGTLLGLVVGALPGLGTVTALAMVLPLTFIMSAPQAIGLLLAIYVSSVFAGSIPAMLINIPGTPQSAATLFDGHPMAQAGRASQAIGWATVASVIGGLFSVTVLILATPQLAAFALRFGSVETFALIVFSLTTIAWVSQGDPIKGLIGGVLGVFLATIGADQMSGIDRFTFGSFALSSGLNVVPLLVGIFALSEVLYSAGREPRIFKQTKTQTGFVVAGVREWWALRATLLRSSLIGTFLGILPGVGATAASLISYAQAKSASRKDTFGTGEPEGLVASETANNAVTGGALVPALSLGIPGDAAVAVIMGALIIHGITPGAQLLSRSPELVAYIFVAMILVYLLMLILGAAVARLYTRILNVPHAVVMGMVLVLSLTGSYVVRFSLVDVATAVIAGFAGLLLRYCGVPLATIVIGFILGGPMETSLRQALILKDMQVLRFLEHPIANGLFAVTILVVVWPLIKKVRTKKQ